ncbi:MAG: ParB N-terminal domain-containing protein [candidate division Zixibacteria bacterium]|nr:ParB N-terminal domain-containing protein [candidate division Zixibacteria bacterium]
MNIENIPVGKLQANPWNPNRMADDMRHKLKEYIKKEGFVEPIVVRPKDDIFEILGGYHRWSIASELGYDTVPCVVVDLDDKRAKILTINLNEMKGQSLPNLLSELVFDLSKEITLADLETQLPYTMDEMKDSLELLKLPDGLEAFLAEETAKQEINKPRILTFVVDDPEPIEKAIAVSMASTEAKSSRGKALMDICRQFTTNIGT